MNLEIILVLSLITLIILIISILILNFVGSLKSERLNAEYLAIRVSYLLDRFVDDCVMVINDDGLSKGRRNHSGCCEVQVTTPELKFDLPDVNWHSINCVTVLEILSFPGHIEAANQLIDKTFEHSAFPPNYDEGFEERQYQYAKLGLRAGELASNLRRTHGLPERECQVWDPIEYMKKQKQEISDLRFQLHSALKTDPI